MHTRKRTRPTGLLFLIGVLGAGCGGGTPLQQRSQPCELELGSDACVEGLVCEPAKAGADATCRLPHDQQESEPCDDAYGIDACGAGLFCAAFDSRKDATCYRLYTRRPGQACLAADNCLNARCTAGACEPGARGEPCLGDSECAAGLTCHTGFGGEGYCDN